MTDNELCRIKAICETASIKDIGDLSDGYHTFNQLYYQRMMLFAALVKAYRDKAWKSYRHEDGELCFGGGWFVVGIETPEGNYTYHYENKDFDLFDCKELPTAPHWDGHTEENVTRLFSLPDVRPVDGLIKMIDEAIKATDNNDTYFVGLKNGLRCAKAFIDGKEPEYEHVVYGEWEEVEVVDLDDAGDWAFDSVASMLCPVCHRYHTEVYRYGDPTYLNNFCPSCGADMRKKEET